MDKLKKRMAGKGKLSYKKTVSLSLLCLIGIFIVLFCWYGYYRYREEYYSDAKREAQYTADRLAEQADERLNNLYQYYESAMLEDEIFWMLENTVRYSDYSHYSDAAETLASKKIFGDYINGYALINFKTSMVLSSKGLFSMEEAYNREELELLRQENTASIYKSFWYYRPGEDTFAESVLVPDRNDHNTIETRGLNLVLKLPMNTMGFDGMCIVNINMRQWKQWLEQWLDEYEEVIVSTADGEVIYSTNAALLEKCRMADDSYVYLEEILSYTEGIETNEGVYMAMLGTSDILGWKYCTFYSMEEGENGAYHLSEVMLLIFLIFLIVCVWVISHIIYKPIGQLMSDLSLERGQENELEYLAKHISGLEEDRNSLEHMILTQQDRLLELFELRLIRGEAGKEEQEEYFQKLHLKKYPCFATGVVVLNLRDEQEEQSNIREDVICLKLAEELPMEVRQYTWMPLVYNACALFCVFGGEDEKSLAAQINGFYDEMQGYARESCGYRVIMGISTTHTDYGNMRAAYRESVNALTLTAYSGEDASRADCHFYLPGTSVKGGGRSRSFENEIRAALRTLDKEQCYKVVDEFYLFFSGCEKQEDALVHILRFANTILLTAMEDGADLGKLYPDGLTKVYQEIVEVVEPARIRRYIKRMLVDVVLLAENEQLERESHSVFEKIEKKLADSKGNITLAECAEELGVNTAYIWKALKLEKGKSFSDYQEAYKLQEAKRLLLQTNLSVAEIAAELKYTNAQNFIRFFSKETGITPGKFRKLYE